MGDKTVWGLVSRVGFPIFVALWFMFRLEGQMAGLKRAIVELTMAINGLLLRGG
ncbi:hypothetical protein LCGC14_0989470 [marine sediment metagenome]|uniref:Uncharacterized protein n=1 Tax=marine sediment metagenome TaxID=412755 RepID=A0A0F9RCU1_9ZZZZ